MSSIKQLTGHSRANEWFHVLEFLEIDNQFSIMTILVDHQPAPTTTSNRLD